MAVQIASTPVSIPSGIRATIGQLDFNGATYSAGGLAFTAAQFGGGANGIPNRLPDFVIFGSGTAAATDNATTAGTVLRYNKSTGKVTVYGTEPLVDEEGLGEDDAAANNTVADFLALWITPDPSGVVTA
jgi:hypothetical protein